MDHLKPILVLTIGMSAAAALSWGCSDDDGGASPDATVDASAIVEPDAAVGDSVTFHVASTLWGSTDFQPVEGASVAFDAPGGQRTESTTDVDGNVTFDGIDWSLGKAAVTAFKFGFSLRSGVNIDATWIELADKVNGAGLLLLYDMNNELERPVVNLMGSATGLDDPSHELVVDSIGGNAGSEWTGTGTGTFSLAVPSGAPFTLQAREREYTELPSGQGYDQIIHRVTHLDHSAITVNTTGVVLDFAANEVTTHTAEGWFNLPSRPESPLHSGTAGVEVSSLDSAHSHGWATHLDIHPSGGRFDVSLLWTEPAGLQNVYTMFWAQDGQDGWAQSLKSFEGYPPAGSLGTLYDTPRWIAPADPQLPHSLWDRFEWELFDEDIPFTQLRVYKGQQLVWVVLPGPNATTATVPAPPSVVDAGIFLGTSNLQGWLMVGVSDTFNARWTSVASSKKIPITP